MPKIPVFLAQASEGQTLVPDEGKNRLTAAGQRAGALVTQQAEIARMEGARRERDNALTTFQDELTEHLMEVQAGNQVEGLETEFDEKFTTRMNELSNDFTFSKRTQEQFQLRAEGMIREGRLNLFREENERMTIRAGSELNNSLARIFDYAQTIDTPSALAASYEQIELLITGHAAVLRMTPEEAEELTRKTKADLDNIFIQKRIADGELELLTLELEDEDTFNNLDPVQRQDLRKYVDDVMKVRNTSDLQHTILFDPQKLSKTFIQALVKDKNGKNIRGIDGGISQAQANALEKFRRTENVKFDVEAGIALRSHQMSFPQRPSDRYSRTRKGDKAALNFAYQVFASLEIDRTGQAVGQERELYFTQTRGGIPDQLRDQHIGNLTGSSVPAEETYASAQFFKSAIELNPAIKSDLASAPGTSVAEGMALAKQIWAQEAATPLTEGDDANAVRARQIDAVAEAKSVRREIAAMGNEEFDRMIERRTPPDLRSWLLEQIKATAGKTKLPKGKEGATDGNWIFDPTLEDAMNSIPGEGPFGKDQPNVSRKFLDDLESFWRTNIRKFEDPMDAYQWSIAAVLEKHGTTREDGISQDPHWVEQPMEWAGDDPDVPEWRQLEIARSFEHLWRPSGLGPRPPEPLRRWSAFPHAAPYVYDEEGNPSNVILGTHQLEENGTVYVVPGMVMGKLVDDPFERAQDFGLENYPQFANDEDAQTWIKWNHGKINKDGNWLQDPQDRAMDIERFTDAGFAEQRRSFIEHTNELGAIPDDVPWWMIPLYLPGRIFAELNQQSAAMQFAFLNTFDTNHVHEIRNALHKYQMVIKEHNESFKVTDFGNLPDKATSLRAAFYTTQTRPQFVFTHSRLSESIGQEGPAWEVAIQVGDNSKVIEPDLTVVDEFANPWLLTLDIDKSPITAFGLERRKKEAADAVNQETFFNALNSKSQILFAGGSPEDADSITQINREGLARYQREKLAWKMVMNPEGAYALARYMREQNVEFKKELLDAQRNIIPMF